MNKELTPLEALERIENGKYFVDFELDAKIGEDYKEEIAIIKTALKKQEQDKKKLKVLKILKAFGFEIEDYTENEHGSIKVKYPRIIVDDEEIDLAKEVLL